MPDSSSRRRFLQTTVAATSIASSDSASASNTVAPASPLSRASIEEEIHRRAAWHHRQQHLVVDYYRIRYTLAYPLPARSLAIPNMLVPTISEYPWVTWMLWALEERIYSLAWAAEWTRDDQLVSLASRDLLALSEFPNYCQSASPDLASGHAGRLLWAASHDWDWVDNALKARLHAACERHAEEMFPLVSKHYDSLHTLKPPASPYARLHNIPLIGTIGATLTANVIHHPRGPQMNEVVRGIFQTILDSRASGYTEAAAYDGYVLDFISDWLVTLPTSDRNQILNHPRLDDCLEQSYRLAAPGAIEQLAELADVEPREMPFHQAAQVKLARWKPSPVRGWYLGQWRPSRMRANALGVARNFVDHFHGAPPEEQAANAHYAVVLRTGWKASDLAVAMSATNSPSGHLPPDNGTILIGTAGEWLLTDPGYQQYIQGEERDFTLGPTAHNYPLINGLQQTNKLPRLLTLEAASGTLSHAVVDLTKCYPARLIGHSVKRHLWLHGNHLVVVADEMKIEGSKSVKYHWHGHPQAAWWAENGQLLISLNEANLWLGSPQLSLDLAAVTRLPGSRGQLTAAAAFDSAPPVLWWVFSLGGKPLSAALSAEGRAITISGQTFSV